MAVYLLDLAHFRCRSNCQWRSYCLTVRLQSAGYTSVGGGPVTSSVHFQKQSIIDGPHRQQMGVKLNCYRSLPSQLTWFASRRSHLVRMTQVAPAPASAGRCWNKSQIHVVQAYQWVYHSHLPFAGLPGIVEWLTSIVSLKDWISGKITNILRYYFIMK